MQKWPVGLMIFVALNIEAHEQEVSVFDLELEALLQLEVTVQRRIENILEVPMATSVLREDPLQNQSTAGDDLRVLTSRLPSLQVESSFGRTFPRFYVRGIGNTSFDLNASQPVSHVYDDVVLESPILKGLPLFDLSQLELARGPQGTLFGRNSPAGVLKIKSALPTENFGGFVRFNLGRFQTQNLEAAITGALSEGWSARWSVLDQQRDNWVNNSMPGRNNGFEGYHDRAMRLQLRYQSPTGIESLVKLHQRQLDSSSRLFRANIIAPGSHHLVKDLDPRQVAQDGENTQKLQHQGVSWRLTVPFPQVDLFSITAYETADVFSRGDIDGGYGAADWQPMTPGFIPFSSESAAALPRHGQLTQEIRVASKSAGPYDWQAGLFWFDESQKVENFNYNTKTGGQTDGYAVIRQKNHAIAAFGNLGYAVNTQFHVRAGIRQTRDHKQFSAERPITPGGAAPLLPRTATSDESNLSWDLSALWRLNDGYNAFLRIAEGYRAPSFQGRVIFSDEISQAHSEQVLSVEAGLKAELVNKRFRYGLTFFSYQLDDPQLTAVGGSKNVSQLLNADHAVGRGIEFEFDSKIGRRWSLSGGLSYNYTAIRDQNLFVRVCGAACTVLDPLRTDNGVTVALVDGNPLPYSPRWIGQLNIRYQAPVAVGMAYLQSDWTFRSKMGFFLYQSQEFQASSLLEGGLRVGYRWQQDHYDLALFVRNLTDKTALIGAIDFNNLTGMLNEPQIWGVEFKAHF